MDYCTCKPKDGRMAPGIVGDICSGCGKKSREIYKRKAMNEFNLIDNICDVCAGTGKTISGVPCICGGDGTLISMVNGLRKRVIELEKD